MELTKKTKTILACGLLGVTAVTAGCTQQQAQKADPVVATVDYQLVMENHPDMQAAQDKMKTEYDKIRNDLKDTENLPPEERQKKAIEAQKKLDSMSKEAVTPIKTSVDGDIDEVMKSKNAIAVVDKHAVIRGGTDITKEVLVKEGVDADKADTLIKNAEEQQAQ